LTPLSNIGDKYSRYADEPYGPAITNNLIKMGVREPMDIQLIEGLSTDAAAIVTAVTQGPYDIIYIDGGHDYEVVCHDIATFVPMLKSGGYLVMDDACCLIENPYGQFLGHMDVSNAARDKLEGRSDLTHLFAVGHNRVWRKA
jgi:predicted O-methyltransferase YrrM